MKTKKTLFFLIVLFFSVGSVIAQPPGLPGQGDGNSNTFDIENPAPIDGQIWLGLIGGLAIGGYFLIKNKQTITHKLIIE